MKSTLILLLFAFAVVKCAESQDASFYVNVFDVIQNIRQWLTNSHSSFNEYLTVDLDSVIVLLTELTDRMDNNDANINRKLKQHLSHRCQDLMYLDELEKYSDYIDIYYRKMETYVTHYDRRSKSSSNELWKLSFEMVSDDDDFANINVIKEKLFSKHIQSKIIFNGFSACLNENLKLIHDFRQSHQQIIHSFFQSLLLTEVKSYVLHHFSYKCLSEAEEGSFKRKIARLEEEFTKNIQVILKLQRNSIKNASRKFWRDEPQNHVRGETFEEVFALAQQIMLSEENLNKDGKCEAKSCEIHEMNKQIRCREELCKAETPKCKEVIDCKSLHQDVTICRSNDDARRYDFIKNGSEILGKERECGSDEMNVPRDAGCSFCLCLCVDRVAYSLPKFYINLLPSLANTDKNYVVTGVRFVKNNNVLHLQIQEGRLTSHGNIDSRTVDWKPVENYTIIDEEIESNDYQIVSWNSTRAFKLDEVVAEDGHAVTGVKLDLIENNEVNYVRLVIIATPFNYTTGKLKSYTTNYGSKHFANHIELNDPDVPTLATNIAINSQSGDYIKFQPSSLKKDASQTTVPYFDVQEVTSSIYVPLQGIGMFYKDEEGFGGFIAPSIITYDVTKHIVNIL